MEEIAKKAQVYYKLIKYRRNLKIKKRKSFFIIKKEIMEMEKLEIDLI